MPATAEAELLYSELQQQPSAEKGLVLNAVAAPGLEALAVSDPDCWQPMRHEVRRMQALGMEAMTTFGEQPYDWVAVLPMKGIPATLGLIAEAWRRLRPGGRLWLAAANRFGAKRWQEVLQKLGEVRASAKRKCRLYCVSKHDGREALVGEWLRQAAPRRAQGHGLWTQPGLFSWDRIDEGSRMLLACLPETLAGQGMDLCCGYGALSVGILQRDADIRHLTLVDTDFRALQMAERNLEPYRIAHDCLWRDAADEDLPAGLDWIVCNPPFHEGQHRDVSLGQRILARACACLRPRGRLWLVANRQLPYERVLSHAGGRVRQLAQREGFKVLLFERER